MHNDINWSKWSTLVTGLGVLITAAIFLLTLGSEPIPSGHFQDSPDVTEQDTIAPPPVSPDTVQPPHDPPPPSPPGGSQYIYKDPPPGEYFLQTFEYSIRRIRSKVVGEDLRIELLFLNESEEEARFWMSAPKFIDDLGHEHIAIRGMENGVIGIEYPPRIPMWIPVEFSRVDERALTGSLTFHLSTTRSDEGLIVLRDIPIRDAARS